MLNLGPLAFASPWILGFLVSLPVLWWLLRLIPPSPKKILFPALALLQGLVTREETPAHAPWWLLLLRLASLALLIAAFAKPVINPIAAPTNQSPLLLVIDNDWAAARDWDARTKITRDIIEQAKTEHRPIFILSTTSMSGEDLQIAGPLEPEAALATANSISPKPWPADWAQAANQLQKLNQPLDEIIWLASGIGGTDANILYETMRKTASLHVYGTSVPIYALTPPAEENGKLALTVTRADTELPGAAMVNGIAKNGGVLVHTTADFKEGSPRAMATIDMPPDLRNRITRFEIESPRTAAATALLDTSWEHRAVGIVGDAAELDRRSLLSETFYIDRALKPYADIRVDTLENLLKADMPTIIMPDSAPVSGEAHTALADWLKHGGTLIRFLGERFAAAADHEKETDILPVTLRGGGRALGGSMTWNTPQKLQPFPPESPFHNLAIPADVTVNRQLLAEPFANGETKTWAALTDGTPLVTAAAKGRGISILFHVPAQSSWSNLPISGLFVDMLRKTVELSRQGGNLATQHNNPLRPLSVLDAFGSEHTPGSTILPVEPNGNHPITPQNPPGIYGDGAHSIALNLSTMIGQPEALRAVPLETYKTTRQLNDIQPHLLVAAILLLLLDFLLSLHMRGFLKIAALLLACVLSTATAQAADTNEGVERTSKTYLGYMRTGDAATDRVSELGMHNLATTLQNRTAIDEISIARIDPNSDDLAFYPFIYWPLTTAQKPVTAEGIRRINHYLRHGGMILFDAAGTETLAPAFMQRLLTGIEIPPLTKLPTDHVLKRSFYILNDVPGRFTGKDMWLEPEEASAYDGVASVLYGSNGWAAAWAVDETGRPLFPCMPGGEAQREQALRFGVNIVMYALTGNYKNDQLQTTALLKRMGK